MHRDLTGNASAFLATAKVLVCFITEILFLITAYAIIKKKFKLAITGVLGSLLFIGLYLIEFIDGYKSNPQMLMWFLLFGGLSLMIGVNSKPL